MAAHNISTYQRDQICARWLRGEKSEAIAASVGVHDSTVKRVTRRAGLVRRNFEYRLNRSWPKAKVEKFTALWKSGATLVQISTELGVSVHTVNQTRKRLGFPGRKNTPQRQSPPTPAMPFLSGAKAMRALWLWDMVLNTQEIAARLNAVEAAVYNSLSNARSERRATRYMVTRKGRDAIQAS